MVAELIRCMDARELRALFVLALACVAVVAIAAAVLNAGWIRLE